MTTVSSCTMIEAVMYGMMPIAKTDSWSSAPPEKRLISVYMLFCPSSVRDRSCEVTSA